ncbi:hypothetical protein [Vagococcus carniphilus]|uniref:hypothetical protein n=1 Tax=Vagococcus carniphilus TaxID=218144 RepID=UPI003BA9B502
MTNITPLIIMLIIMTVSAILCSLLLSAYMSTLNFKEAILLIYDSVLFHKHKKIKLNAYKAVHNQKIKIILNKIVSTRDNDLVQANPEMSIQDAKKIKEIANQLLKNETYFIKDATAKKEIKDLGLNSYIYTFQLRLAFASDPNNQYAYSKYKQNSKSIIKNKQQLKAMQMKTLLKKRNTKSSSNLDKQLLGALITFDSTIQKLFKNKDNHNYAVNI